MNPTSQRQYYTKLFFYGAIWNWIVSIPFLFGYKWILPLLGMSLPVYPVFLIFTLFFACLFGLGYYWVSEDIDQNHGIVKMGIIGKLGTAVIIPWAYFINQISPILLITAIGDLIFALLFIRFLQTYQDIDNFQ